MKRMAVFLLLAFLCAFNFYSAFFPEFSRRYFPLPFQSDSLRKVVHLLAGGLFLLCVLFLVYATINPRG